MSQHPPKRETMNDEYIESQEALTRHIQASPIVATCQECDSNIRQGEIEHGVATNRECAQCVRDEVLSMVGDF
jgi:hypothetical protein